MIGILAYGSLIDDPGREIEPAIISGIKEVDTPFRIEFARASRTRDGAPTLIPVSQGGSTVSATVLVLESAVSESQAKDILWRREMRREGLREGYSPPARPGPNDVLVERLDHFEGLKVVFYTRIGNNIGDITPQKLAELAISSAKKKAGTERKDGLAYLIDAKRNGISTPLMPAYEAEILRLTGSETLERSREMLVNQTHE